MIDFLGIPIYIGEKHIVLREFVCLFREYPWGWSDHTNIHCETWTQACLRFCSCERKRRILAVGQRNRKNRGFQSKWCGDYVLVSIRNLTWLHNTYLLNIPVVSSTISSKISKAGRRISVIRNGESQTNWKGSRSSIDHSPAFDILSGCAASKLYIYLLWGGGFFLRNHAMIRNCLTLGSLACRLGDQLQGDGRKRLTLARSLTWVIRDNFFVRNIRISVGIRNFGLLEQTTWVIDLKLLLRVLGVSEY